MKLLFDDNLSPKLVAVLIEDYPMILSIEHGSM